MRVFILFVSAAFYINCSLSNGQSVECIKTGGIFKTTGSYFHNQYSDSVCLDNKKNSIHKGYSYNLVIRADGNKTTFKCNEIYGYYDGKDTYRYFKTNGIKGPKGYFKIEDTSGLIIYSQIHYYFRHRSIDYYYSKGLGDPINILDIKSLKSDFDNTDFFKWANELKTLNQKNGSVFFVNELYKKYIR
jgi:hypothetical protein